MYMYRQSKVKGNNSNKLCSNISKIQIPMKKISEIYFLLSWTDVFIFYLVCITIRKEKNKNKQSLWSTNSHTRVYGQYTSHIWFWGQIKIISFILFKTMSVTQQALPFMNNLQMLRKNIFLKACILHILYNW